MKKSLLTIIAVVAVLAATYLADRATRQPRKGVVSVAAGSSASKPNAAGKPAPEVTLRDLDGKDLALSQYKGKVVLVNFWATWCEPCQVEIPWLIEIQQKYAAKGFTVLGIAMDEEGAKVVTPWVNKERFDVNGTKSQMNYPIVIGNDAAADKFGGLLGYPTSVLITRDGKIIKRITGIISSEGGSCLALRDPLLADVAKRLLDRGPALLLGGRELQRDLECRDMRIGKRRDVIGGQLDTLRPLGGRRLLRGGECRAGDCEDGGAGNKCFPHGILHELVAAHSESRADLAHKLSFGHAEQQSVKRSNEEQAPDNRAPARTSLCCDQAQRLQID